MQKSIISWTGVTWNPTFGCSKVSEGCRYCYAETISTKFKMTTLPWTAANTAENVSIKRHKLREPFKLKEPSRIFVNSMSDLFHEQIPDSYIHEVFDVMDALPQHVFQILTKRPDRAAKFKRVWANHIWMGTSVEDSRVLHRVDSLRECNAIVKWLSCEPLINTLGGLDTWGIDWVVVGGETGQHMRSQDNPRWMKHKWARDIRDTCLLSETAFFFKQSSGIRTEMGTALEHEDGSFWEWQQFPDDFKPPRERL